VIKYVVQDAFGCLSDTVALTVNVLPVSSTTLNASVCFPATYSFNGQTLANSGTYTFVTPNFLGCDSLVTLNLLVKQPTQSTQTSTACDSLVWNGQIYRVSGAYSFLTTNAAGCDSTAALNLTVGYTRDTALSLTACDSLVWNGQTLRQSGQYSALFQGSTGCDSTVRLTLNMGKTDSLIQQTFVCDSIFWQISGTWIKQSGTYVVRRGFSSRCDSVYRLNLQVDRTPAAVGAFDSVICWLPGYELWYLDRNRADLVWYEPGNPQNVFARGSLFVLNDNFDVLDVDVSASSTGGCLSPPTRIRVRNEIYDPFTPMPNAFSPDGNGTNDVWFVESKFSMELRIFDRWGRLIHQDSGLRVSWDGKNYDPGVYPYEIRQNNCVGQKVSTKGVINLIR
jgi:gliding motility-associated-like protein